VSSRDLLGPTVVTHAYNPNYLGGRDPEDCSSRAAKTKSSLDPISTNSQEGWHTFVILVIHGSEIGRSQSRLASASSETLISRITKAKMAGGMSQVLEQWLSKLQALSSTLQYSQKKIFIGVMGVHSLASHQSKQLELSNDFNRTIRKMLYRSLGTIKANQGNWQRLQDKRHLNLILRLGQGCLLWLKTYKSKALKWRS
jgi:hypothetical protein